LKENVKLLESQVADLRKEQEEDAIQQKTEIQMVEHHLNEFKNG